MQERLYNMLLDENEVTWQTIIYELVKSEEIDPWDINISLLTKKYLETIKELQEHNFFISGKVILAASILLRMKTIKFLDEDMPDFDNLLFQNNDEDLLLDNFENEGQFVDGQKIPGLLIKTPQARKRKVNLDDLMSALKEALEVENKRLIRRAAEREIRKAEIPIKKIDISSLINNLYSRIKEFFAKHSKVTFTQLLPSQGKMDKILTFLPLLHLENQGKISMKQEVPFGEIEISEANDEED